VAFADVVSDRGALTNGEEQIANYTVPRAPPSSSCSTCRTRSLRRENGEDSSKINDQAVAGVALAPICFRAPTSCVLQPRIGSGGLTAAAHRNGEPLCLPIHFPDGREGRFELGKPP